MSRRDYDVRVNSFARVADPPSSARPFVYDDDHDQELVVRHKDTKEWDNGDYESHRYERDYYSDREYDQSTALPEKPPHPIFIREGQPVIIQEARGPIYVSNHDEPDYHVVRRPDRDVRERDVEIRYHHEVEDDLTDSQPARSHRGRDRDRDYSSDDSLVYIRKETREYDETPAHHGLHLAEGAALGVGAAELFRRRNKSQGEASSGWGRIGRDVGAGALGVVAAEGIHRARSQHRSKSRRRSELLEPDRGSHHHHHSHRSRHRDSRHRHRSSSASKSGGVNMKQIAGLGIGAAALAAGVALARKKSSDRRERRSRSRHRRSSPSFSDETATTVTTTTNNGNSSHRNKRMAEAGLAGAAVAGLIERARSKSRSRKGERSRSQNRLKQALPVLAAGAGSAALAGLYEKNKAKNAEEEVKSTRSRSRSRRRSRSRGALHDSAGLIEYGQDPVYQTDYYGRSTSAQGYHSDEMVRTSRRHRSRSRSAALYDSDDSDRTDRRRHRHRELAEAAAVSGGLGYVAGKHVERHEKNRERQSQDRRIDHDDRDLDHGHDPYEELYDPIYTPSPPPTGRSDQFYPNTMNFPPPPGSGPTGPPHMSDYPPPPGAPPPPRSYPYPPPPLGSPGNDPYEPLPRRGDENVSAPYSDKHHTRHGLRRDTQPSVRHRPWQPSPSPPHFHSHPHKMSRRRSASQPPPPQSKTVVFNISDDPLPEKGGGGNSRNVDPGYESDDSDSTIDGSGMSRARHRPRRRYDQHRRSSSHPSTPAPTATTRYSSPPKPRPSSSLPAARNPRPSSHDVAARDSDSESTIDLPPRFDQQGHPLPDADEDDDSAGPLERLLNGFGFTLHEEPAHERSRVWP